MPRRSRPIWAWAMRCSSRATMPTRVLPFVRPPSTAPIRLLPPHSASSVVASLKSGRPADAVETYRTAIDFAGPRDDTRALNAGMGQALSAAGRPSDALDAFNAATADGIYQLTSEQADELARVHDSLAAVCPDGYGHGSGARDGRSAVDPLDPTGTTGQFMPDPSDTGFFTLSESRRWSTGPSGS